MVWVQVHMATASIHPGRRVVLLLGSPRSGTSWLAKVLDTYKNVCYAHEPFTKALNEPRWKELCTRLKSGALESQEREELVEVLSQCRPDWAKLPFFPKDFRSCPAPVLQALWIVFRLTGWGGACYRRLSCPPPDRFPDLLIKEVEWHVHARAMIEGLKPDHLLLLVRHPCAVVSSRLEGLRRQFDSAERCSEVCAVLSSRLEGLPLGVMPSFGDGWENCFAERCRRLGFSAAALNALETYEFFALMWLVQNMEYQEMARAHPQATTVVYENLCADPLGTSRSLFDRLGWEWGPCTEQFLQESTKPPPWNRLRGLLRGSRSYFDVYKNPAASAFSWRERLTGAQQRRILDLTCRFPDVWWWPAVESELEQKEEMVPCAPSLLRPA
jgi:hypothetical protein